MHAPPIRPVTDITQPPTPTVLQVLPSLVTGGVERGTVDIARAIAAGGGRSVVVSNGGPLVQELEAGGAEHVRLPVHSKSPVTIALNARRLATLIRRYDIGIVHARSRAPAWSALLAARATGRPFVTTFHGVYNEGSPLKHAYNSVMARGDPVIAASHFVAAHIERTYGVAPNRIRVIARGVDVAAFDIGRIGPERSIRLRQLWQVPAGSRLVLLPGRLTRWKGQKVLLEAMARLNRTDLCCVLLGSDQGRLEYRAELIETAARLGIAAMIRLPGECDDMPAAYRAAELVVSASTDPEAFGRVMAEAQAAGVPVIASDLGAAPEIVPHGETGWLFPAGDPAALAATIAEALTRSPEQCSRMAEAAATRARLLFSKERMCRETLALYTEVGGA